METLRNRVENAVLDEYPGRVRVCCQVQWHGRDSLLPLLDFASVWYAEVAYLGEAHFLLLGMCQDEEETVEIIADWQEQRNSRKEGL